MLKHIDILEEQVLSLDQEIQERMKPVKDQVSLVDSIPGVAEALHLFFTSPQTSNIIQNKTRNARPSKNDLAFHILLVNMLSHF